MVIKANSKWYHRRCDSGLKAQVFVRGENLSNRCFYVDTRRHVLGLHLHKDGKPYLIDGGREVAKEWIKCKPGELRIEWIPCT